jgi:hypothetical protein
MKLVGLPCLFAQALPGPRFLLAFAIEKYFLSIPVLRAIENPIFWEV